MHFENSLDVIQKSSSLAEVFDLVCKTFPEKIVFYQARAGSQPREWSTLTYADLKASVDTVTEFLFNEFEMCPDKPHRVAICANSRPEWLICDMATLKLGGQTVSVYTSLPADDMAFIVEDSAAKVVIVENQEQADKCISLLEDDRLPSVQVVIALEEVNPYPKVIQYRSIIKKKTGKEATFPEISRDSTASIVYTSGSTGVPKGVLQTHGNHLSNLAQVIQANIFGPGGSMFLYLPLAHSFARLVGYLGLFTDTALKFPSITNREHSQLDLHSVTEDMRSSHCDYFPSIPRLFEKAKNTIERKARGKSFNDRVLRACLNSSLAYYKAGQNPEKISLSTRIIYNSTDFIREGIKAKIFGDNFVHAISGGAKLDQEIAEFFAALGMTILQGYGLTETCVATNCNRPGENKIGSVGPVFDGIEINIESDGEILFRGPNGTRGYLNRPEETDKSWTKDGWFKTGDLGRVDEEGFLYVTGRKKEIIVTAGGKKVPPRKIEQKLESLHVVETAVLYGNDRPFCVALIVPPHEIAKELEGVTELKNVPAVWNEIEILNKSLARFEQVRKGIVIPEAFSTANGLLTPTMKLRRNAVYDLYSEHLEALYKPR